VPDPVRDVLDAVRAWRAAGDAVAVATVVGVLRSAPRPVGAKMAVSSSGALAGAVSGGCVEASVAAAAEDVLATGVPVLRTFGVPDEDAWEVGLPCGGAIEVWIDRWEA
jgi:xanthine dehydrogenase accessory factor